MWFLKHFERILDRYNHQAFLNMIGIQIYKINSLLSSSKLFSLPFCGRSFFVTPAISYPQYDFMADPTYFRKNH
jgi:hypothetical protein